MYEERSKQQKPNAKKSSVEASMAESAKVSDHQQRKKLVVRFADTPEPITIKVKPDMKKGKPLIIPAKSSKSVNVASLINQSDQEVPWFDMLIGYHTSTGSDLYSPAARRIFRLMGGNTRNHQIYPALMVSSHNRGSQQET